MALTVTGVGMGKGALVSIVTALMLLAGYRTAEACSCAAIPPPRYMTDAEVDAWAVADQPRRIRDAYDSAIAVFSGEVILDDVERVRFRLDRAWKGELAPEFFMMTGAKRSPDGIFPGTSCDFVFEVGKKYLIFASGRTLDSMETGACSYSSGLANAEWKIKVLDELVGERAKKY